MQFVDNRLYRLKIPIDVEVYYYESDLPGFIIETELSFGAVLQNLLGEIRAGSVSIQPNVFSDQAYPDKKYFKISTKTRIPLELHLGSRVAQTTRSNYSFKFSNTQKTRNSELSAFVWSKAAHSDYRVIYPKLEFWISGWKVNNSDALINDYRLLPEIPLNTANSAKSLTIEDYFIGHEPVFKVGSSSESLPVYTSQPLRIRIKFSVPADFNFWYPLKFQLEFSEKTLPGNQYLLFAGDISDTAVITSASKDKAQGQANFLVRYGHDPAKNTVTMASIKALNASAEMLTSMDHKFITKLRKISSKIYEIELIWKSDPRMFTLAAELPRISLKICNYLQQPLYAGTGLKQDRDTYTNRSSNPFYRYGSNFAWYPRYGSLKINDREATSVGVFLDPARVPNLSSYVNYTNLNNSIRYYRAYSTSGNLSIKYKLRLNCRGYFSPNTQRNYFAPDVFFPLNAVLGGSYRKNNQRFILAIGSRDKLLSQYDDRVTYTFDRNTNEVEVVVSKAKLTQLLNLIVGTPNKATHRKLYLFLNTEVLYNTVFTNRYVNNKPSLGAILMYEV